MVVAHLLDGSPVDFQERFLASGTGIIDCMQPGSLAFRRRACLACVLKRSKVGEILRKSSFADWIDSSESRSMITIFAPFLDNWPSLPCLRTVATTCQPRSSRAWAR